MKNKKLMVWTLSMMLSGVVPSAALAESMGDTAAAVSTEMPDAEIVAVSEMDNTIENVVPVAAGAEVQSLDVDTTETETAAVSAAGTGDIASEDTTGTAESDKEDPAAGSSDSTVPSETTKDSTASSETTDDREDPSVTTENSSDQSGTTDDGTDRSETTEDNEDQSEPAEESDEEEDSAGEDQTQPSLAEDFLKILSITVVRTEEGITVTLISQNTDYTGIYFGGREDASKAPVYAGELQTDGTVRYEFTIEETKAGQIVYYVPLSSAGEWYTEHDLIMQLPQITEITTDTEEETETGEGTDSSEDAGSDEESDTAEETDSSSGSSSKGKPSGSGSHSSKGTDSGSADDTTQDTDADSTDDTTEDTDADSTDDTAESTDSGSNNDTTENTDSESSSGSSRSKSGSKSGSSKSRSGSGSGSSKSKSGSGSSSTKSKPGSGSGSSKDSDSSKKKSKDGEDSSVPDDLITIDDAPEIEGFEYLGTVENESAQYFRIHYYEHGVKMLEISLAEGEPDWDTAEKEAPYDGEVLQYVIAPQNAELPADVNEHMIVVDADAAGFYVDASGSLDVREEMANMNIPVLVDRSSAEKDEEGQQEWMKVYQILQ